jgi:DNA gyrase subunit A
VLLCKAEEINYLEGTGRGLILIKLGKGDRVIGFAATSKKDEGLTVVTNRGAEKSITPSSYGVTSRAGRGRELLKNGTLTAVVPPEVAGPELFEGQKEDETVS